MCARILSGTVWLSVHSLSYRMFGFQEFPLITNHIDLWVGIRWNESHWLSSNSQIMTWAAHKTEPDIPFTMFPEISVG